MKTKTSPKKGTAPTVHKIFIVDDHPVLREGLAQLIDQQKDISICGQFEDGSTAFESIATLKPDLALVDISLKGSNGIELLKNIKTNYPKLLVLVLSMHDESLYAERALRAGAAGYIMKQEATEKVLEAIRKVLAGQIYLSEKISTKLMHQLVSGHTPGNGSLMDRLSDRELEVFGLIGQGRGTRQIAEQLHLSVKTIESHRAHIKEKLNLNNATELVHRAIQMRAM